MDAIDNDLNQSTLILKQILKKYKKKLKMTGNEYFYQGWTISKYFHVFLSQMNIFDASISGQLKKTLSVFLSYVKETVKLILVKWFNIISKM